MTWLLILVVLAAAFAPVAYMMPTKRDRALTELRMLARREGLDVDVSFLPKLDAEPHERVSASGKPRDAQIECVSYGLRFAKRQLAPVRYRLLRSEEREFPVAADAPWELDRSFAPATAPVPPAAYWAVLSDVESLLPVDVLGLAVTDDSVLIYWRERLKPEAAKPAAGAAGGKGRDSAALVADIRLLLNKVAQYHDAFFAPASPDPGPESAH